MSVPTLYPAQVGSPYTTLAAPYATGEATMTVVDATKLPDAPNIVCLAGSVAGEFRYSGKDGNTLLGVVKLPGTPNTIWPVGTYAFRGIAAYDLNAIYENMVRTATYVVAASDAPDHVKRQADYVCDGVDDHEEIQAAIDATPSGIVLLRGTFNINQTISILGHSNFTLQGGEATIIRDADMNDPAIVISSTDLGTYSANFGNTSTITLDYNIGAKSLQTAGVTGYSPRDLIKINELNSTEYERITTIESVDPDTNTITPVVPLKWGTISGISNIQKMLSWCDNITIRDIQFTDLGATKPDSKPLITCDFCHNLNISGICIYAVFARSGISIGYSHRVSISNIKIDGINDVQLGYGITIGYGTSEVVISDCIIQGTRHAITGDRAYDITISNVVASGINDALSASFDTHEHMKDITYSNCVSNGAKSGLNIRAQRVCVSNMVINGSQSDGVTIQSMAKDVDISNLQVYNCGTWGEMSNVTCVRLNGCSRVNMSNVRIIQDAPANSNLLRGIRIDACSDITVSNYSIIDNTGSEFVHGVECTNACDNIKFISGIIRGCRDRAIVLSTATNSTIRDLITPHPISAGGYSNNVCNVSSHVNSNSGAAATVADGGTIAHGCVKAPTKVTLTGSVAGEIVTVTSIDATNITVAIKKPDGSAGTPQTVYWRAEV
jgi:hypothetical protein